MGEALHHLGRACARWPLLVLGAWALVFVIVGTLVATFGTQTSNDLSLPGTGSQHVTDLLTERFPPQQNGVNPIVFQVDSGKLTDDANKEALSASVKAMRHLPHVYSVTNPLSSSGQTAGLLSQDGRTAFAPVLLNVGSGELDESVAQTVFDGTKPAQDAGITVAAAGSIGSELSQESTEKSEIVGILAAMLILTLVLGSVVAMGLPILSAIIGLIIALATVGLLGHFISIPNTAATLATMIGLGVGIDYALFMVTRHQEQIRDGTEVKESIARTVATSGSAIVFAGGTVVVALVALRVSGIPILSTLGLAAAIAVVTAVFAAITLLPAMLALLGERINVLSLPASWRARSEKGRMWASWAALVGRRPVWIVAGSLLFLIPLIIPASSLQFAQEDIGATSLQTTQRQAYDLITAGFGVGYNGPLQVASKLDPVATPSATYTKKYDEATSLQKSLKQQSKQLTRQQQQLEAQQRELERQQQQLEAQQASLERQAAALSSQGAQLQAQRAQLEQEQRALEAEQARLQNQRDHLEDRARALAQQALPLARQLVRIIAREKVLQRRIAHLDDHPQQQARLQARLDALQVTEQQVRKELAPLKRQAQRLAERGRNLAAKAAQLNAQAQQLQAQANELQRQANALQVQEADLTAQGDALQQQANALQRQADSLQQQANELKAQKHQAEQEKKRAEQLQRQLTAMVVVAGGDPRNTDPRVVALQDALSATSGVLVVTPPQTNKHGDVVLLSAVPTTAPASEQTTELLTSVRSSVLPTVNDRSILSFVGGYTASYADLATLISQRLLLVIGTVILLGFLLLMVAFRSILVPLQAAITNVLSAAAAFGVLTATFQWGWGISLVGIDTARDTVPIASYVPLMMFAVLFGLSMDYQVFLVSRIDQHRFTGEPAKRAVVSGLASSARITTAACLIMTAVFASFIFNGDPTIKQFGVGLACAVLLAGILVITLAPAAILLMGESAWWLPRWLDRFLPHINIEGDDSPDLPQ